jgi:proteasome lid subunit RPN8/RPN11
MEGIMTSQVKVVRVIARMNVGGPALQVADLSAGLAERYPTLLVTGEVADGEAELVDRARARGVQVVKIPELGRRLRPWHDLVALMQLVRLMRRHRPRIVHTHTAKAGTLGRIAAILARVPVRVHTYHGHVFRGYFGPALTRAFLLIERTLARFTTRLVTVSPGQARELVEEFRICPAERMTVIHLGLELDRYAPALTAPLREELRSELGVAEGVPVVSIVGRLAPIKNHDLFLEAAAGVAAAGEPCHFTVVGGGSEEERLRARASQLGLDGRVTSSAGGAIWIASTPAVTWWHSPPTTKAPPSASSRRWRRGGRWSPPMWAASVTCSRTVAWACWRRRETRPPLPRRCCACCATPRFARSSARGIENATRRFGAARLVDDMDRLYDELTRVRARTWPPAPSPE